MGKEENENEWVTSCVFITLQIAQIEIANWKYANMSISQKLPYTVSQKKFLCSYQAIR